MKTRAIVFCIILLLLPPLIPTSAATVQLTYSGQGRVVEVLDGDALRVKLAGTPSDVLVRLAAVDAVSNDGAIAYLTQQALGRDAVLFADHSGAKPLGRFTACYVYVNGVCLNRDMLQKGLVKWDSSYRNSAQNSGYSLDEMYAQTAGVGLWQPAALPYSSIAVSGAALDINSASVYQLQTRLTGVSYALAQAIVSYRGANYFDSVGEIKFVPGMTKAIYDLNRYNMKVAWTTIVPAIPAATADINTGTLADLTAAGLTQSQAQALIASRGVYTYKYIGELRNVSGLALTDSQWNALADNLTATAASGPLLNINRAAAAQMQAIGMTPLQIQDALLQGQRMKSGGDVPASLASMVPYISLYTNVNTAAASELAGLSPDFSGGLAGAIIAYRADQPIGSMEELRQIFISQGQESLFYTLQQWLVVR